MGTPSCSGHNYKTDCIGSTIPLINFIKVSVLFRATFLENKGVEGVIEQNGLGYPKVGVVSNMGASHAGTVK